MKTGLPSKNKENPAKVTPSSCNVFADLGIPHAGLALAKANLAHCICEVIEERKRNQTDAAAILGVNQPKVSSLVRGKLEVFTVDRLLKFLNLLNLDVEIAVKPGQRKRQPGQTRVLA